MVVDCARNGRFFLANVQQQLVPARRKGTWAFMDNLAAHNVSGARDAIESVGAKLVYSRQVLQEYQGRQVWIQRTTICI
jgi:hypothetical protein